MPGALICPPQSIPPISTDVADSKLFGKPWYLYFNSLAKTAQAIDLPFITPEQYGAAGDGVKDDSRAWTLAIAAAISTGKAIFASGIYLVSKQGTATLPFDGLSHSYVFLVTSTITILGKPSFMISITDADTANIFWFRLADGVSVNGITATGIGTASTVALYDGALLLFDRCSHVMVHGPRTSNMRGNTLFFQGVNCQAVSGWSSIPGTNKAGSHFASFGFNGAVFRDCTTYGGSRDGDIVHFGQDAVGRATGNRILGCHSYNYAFGDATKTIVFNDAQGLILDAGQDFGLIADSYAYGFFYGIDIKTNGDGNAANGNTIEKCKVSIAVRRGEQSDYTYSTYLNNNIIRPLGGNGNTQDLFNGLTNTVGYFLEDSIGVTIDGGTVEACYLFACSGVVNTSGTTVTRISGDYFEWSLTGRTITIDGVTYTVSSVTSTTELALTSSAGTQSSKAFSFSPEQDYIPVFCKRTNPPVIDSQNDGVSISRVKFQNETNVAGNYTYTRNASIVMYGTVSVGKVDTSGTAVTWVSGDKFTTGAYWAGGFIIINDFGYAITSVTDDEHLVLSSTAGAQTGVDYRVANALQRGYIKDCEFKMYSNGTDALGIPVQVSAADQFTIDTCDFSRNYSSIYPLISFTDIIKLRISKVSCAASAGYINLTDCTDARIDGCQFSRSVRNFVTTNPVPIIYADRVSSLIVEGVRHTQGVSVDNGRLVESSASGNGDLTIRNCQVQFTIFITDWYAWNGTSNSAAANVSQSGNIVNSIAQPGSDFSSLTASRPLKLDASKVPTSGKIDGSSADDFAAGVAAGLVASTGTTGVLQAGTAAMIATLLGVSTAELGYLSGLGSNAQSQLNGLAASIATLQTDVLNLQNDKADKGLQTSTDSGHSHTQN